MPANVIRPSFVYMLRCVDGALYTGVTTDLARRHKHHQAGTASRYTRSRRPTRVVYREARDDHGSALRRDAAIEVLSRQQKLALVRSRRRK
jgi:predicted GIY-YIG superfamily endonuclease